MDNCFAMETYGTNFEMIFEKLHQMDKRNYELEMRAMELELRIVELEDKLECQNKKNTILVETIYEYAKSTTTKSQSTFNNFVDMVYNYGLFDIKPKAKQPQEIRDHMSI